MNTPTQPILFVHGFPLDLRMWEDQEPLGDLAQLRCPNLPGFGGREPFAMHADEVTVGHYADAVRDEIRDWGDEPVVLAALSMGGYIAFECWRRFPEKIARLILCDTQAEADPEQARASRLAGIERARKGRLDPMYEQMASDLIAPSARNDEGLRGRILAMMRAADPVGVEQALFAMIHRPDSRPDLAGISVPVLVIVGEDDALTPPDAANVMAEGIPGAERVVIPGAGHLSPMEKPDAVNRAVREFLER